MEFILDTVDLEEIKDGVDHMPIVGVTSNPSIVKKTSPEDFFGHMREIRKIIGDERSLHIQVIATEADEIVVIAVKDKADVDEAKEILTRHQQDRYNLLQSYEPKQVSRIQDGLVFTKGQYAVLIITSHNDDVRKAFEDTIKSK